MKIKGILQICKGIFSSNSLQFEDADVSPSVSLKRLTQDNHAGFFNIPTNEKVEVQENKIVINKIFMRQGGFIKHTGFVKGNG